MVKVLQSNKQLQNVSTRIYATLLAILVGLAGMTHGIFEVLQGNKPTEGLLLESIGAFTLVQNYLYTGIFAIITGLLLIVWTIGFIHKKSGATVFIILSVILFLVGGGIAQIAGFLITWGAATRINKPLSGYQKVFNQNVRHKLAQWWVPSIILAFGLLCSGIFIWLLFTPPGEVSKVGPAQFICWSVLLTALVFHILAVITGFARDIETRQNYPLF